MRRILWVVPIAGVLGVAWSQGLAQEINEKQRDSAPQQQTKDVGDRNQAADNAPAREAHARAYLGVVVEPLHSSLVNHLASLVGGEYGLQVEDVAEGSPAAKAGLKEKDVVYRYDDQKVFTPEQFLRLVRGDKPGHEVTLSIVRDGKTQTIHAVLGEQQVVTNVQPGRAFSRRTAERFGQSRTAEEREARWASFDAMTLTRLDNNRFRTEIKYRDQQGKLETRTFEGTRDDIHKKIEAQRDLPADERDHLLRAIDVTAGHLDFGEPGTRPDQPQESK